jgi:hypothetical protein
MFSSYEAQCNMASFHDSEGMWVWALGHSWTTVGGIQPPPFLHSARGNNQVQMPSVDRPWGAGEQSFRVLCMKLVTSWGQAPPEVYLRPLMTIQPFISQMKSFGSLH